MLKTRSQQASLAAVAIIALLLATWLIKPPSTDPEEEEAAPERVATPKHKATKPKKPPAPPIQPSVGHNLRSGEVVEVHQKLDPSTEMVPIPNTCHVARQEWVMAPTSTLVATLCLDGDPGAPASFERLYQVDHEAGAVASGKAPLTGMVLRDPSNISNDPNVPPSQEGQGVSVEMPMPNTCTHAILEVRTGGNSSKIHSACVEGASYSKGMMVSLDLARDSRINPDMDSVIKLILKDPSEIPN